MLLQRPRIFIAYGHDEGLKKRIIGALEAIRREKNFRFSIEVVSDASIRTGAGAVSEEVHSALSQASAAIILLTADDVGLSQKKVDEIKRHYNGAELAERFEKRARQNVIFELGFLRKQVGKERMYVIADDGIQMPSNIGDVYRSDPSKSDLMNILTEFLVDRLRLRPEPLVLQDSNASLDYSLLFQSGYNLDDQEMLNLFELQFRQFENEEEKLVFLYERIVFDSYFQKPEWWTRLFREISPKSDLESNAHTGLRLVSEYMAKWRPPEKKDWEAIDAIADDLQTLTDYFSSKNIRPIVGMVLFDYLGLSLHKRAIMYRERGVGDAHLTLVKASQALKTVLDLSKDFEDDGLPLWRGYAGFNYARTLRELNKIDPANYPDEIWQKAFTSADRDREKWRDSPIFLPARIRDGLTTELMHLRATRIDMADPNENLGDRLDRAHAEFKEWLQGPSQNRVRLANNVINTWDRIQKKRGLQ